MPTYDYHCEKCKKDFEFFQSMKDDAVTVCPQDKCRQKTWGQGKVKRQLGTGAGLIFKGSGFYITDYRSEGYKQAAQKESNSNSSSGGDSKPAAADGKPAAEGKTPAPKTESKPSSGEAKSAPGKPAAGGESGKKSKKE